MLEGGKVGGNRNGGGFCRAMGGSGGRGKWKVVANDVGCMEDWGKKQKKEKG